MLGQAPPPARHPWSCGGAGGGVRWGHGAGSRLPPAPPRPAPRPGSACICGQLALLSCWASPRPPSRVTRGQGLPANPTAAPPQLSSRPAALPSPNCRSSCHGQLPPHLPSKCSPPIVLPKRHCQLPAPFLPKPRLPPPPSGRRPRSVHSRPSLEDQGWATPAVFPGRGWCPTVEAESQRSIWGPRAWLSEGKGGERTEPK